jgi:hypothetical protein
MLRVTLALAACAVATGFTMPMHTPPGKSLGLRGAAVSRRAPLNLSMLDFPRIELPESLTTVLKESNLKNPNDLTTVEYNTYSAAAVGGTLVFMLFLGPVAGIFDVSGFALDFLFSALLGGGALAYATLRKDEVADYANKFGAALMDGFSKVLPNVDVPRVELPESLTTVLKESNLKNPNDLTTGEYKTYSAAAVGATLATMLLLGPVSNVFDIYGVVLDFVFSALLGGGALAYATLRKDEVADYANKFGAALLQAADTVAEKIK